MLQTPGGLLFFKVHVGHSMPNQHTFFPDPSDLADMGAYGRKHHMQIFSSIPLF
jgi:hypothetical protein